MLTHLIAFAAGAAVVFYLRRSPAPAPTEANEIPSSGTDPMCAPDLNLDAAIIEFLNDNPVFHINDVCRALEHPKGARFVRAHFHKLMEEGKIRYRNMRYTI